METTYHIVKTRMKTVSLTEAQEKKLYETATKKPAVFSLMASFLKSLFPKKAYKRNIYAEHLEQNN